MKLPKNYQQQSLETLEGANWGSPAEAPTNIIERCLTLRKVPLEDFLPEDLRILIGQDIDFPFLVPMALDVLRENIFLETEYYEGDLLKMLLDADLEFWNKHPKLQEELYNMIKDFLTDLDGRKIPFQHFLESRTRKK